MNRSKPAPTTARRPRAIILALLVVVSAVLVGALIGRPPASSSSSAAPPSIDTAATGTPSPAADRPRRPPRPGGDHHGAPGGSGGESGGAVPDGVTVFDGEVPGVANLDPDLLGALRQAATDAADDGVQFQVNSGWRSPEYQEQLLRAAVSEYGSEKEAARWVATPDTSLHVSGDAVDLGGSEARAWLSAHGAQYGLCQIYGNEPWHYELRPEATDGGCPPLYANPTQDPRMQQ